MKQNLLILLAALGLAAGPNASAQTTAFTYQGQLIQNGAVAGGTYDLQFSLYNVATAGSAIAGPLSATLVVTDGRFTVPLDFGRAPTAPRPTSISPRASR
jgi:hypothetical protein